ncbi:MBL fold metallo-hydrolase [Candidatus Poribacteria bacterium]|nr:MBL fold metallo-hydrolase [Candidatus Poribacteria bacterium]
MKVTLWGVRGSIPTPMSTEQYQAKLRSVLRRAAKADLSDDDAIAEFVARLPKGDRELVGGNTTCVQVHDDETHLIFDAGSGMRPLGQSLMSGPFARGAGCAHIFFSHHHHDHTCGFPFFTPAYIPGNEIHFYGVHENIDTRMMGLQAREYFPVPFHVMASKKAFHQMEEDVPIRVGEFTITASQMNHPGVSYGYRVRWRDRVFVFASDSEYKNPTEQELNRYTDFFQDADLVYFDGQYSLQEAFIKENWGHSSALVGVDFAVRANIRTLLISHHEPAYSDDTIADLIQQARDYLAFAYPDAQVEIEIAYAGDTYDLTSPG